MPIVVGIDEAGYGPNLGPLVQAAVAVRCPDHTANLWKTLRHGVRRAHADDDGRMLIDDSKRVKASPMDCSISNTPCIPFFVAVSLWADCWNRLAVATGTRNLRAKRGTRPTSRCRWSTLLRRSRRNRDF